MHLYLGNKLYSSWSLRPWLAMKAAKLVFDETVIPLYRDGSKAAMLKVSPTGKVPTLVDGDVTVWESLAIIEYVAEKFPDAGIWAKDVKARAHARAVSNEMHAGFQALRRGCPMNLGKKFARRERGPDVAADVARIQEVWAEARSRFGKGGPFLYGAFTAADAMYAPVVTRLDTYQIGVGAGTRDYMEAVLDHPAFVAWRKAALDEPWELPHYEEGETAVEIYHRPPS